MLVVRLSKRYKGDGSSLTPMRKGHDQEAWR